MKEHYIRAFLPNYYPDRQVGVDITRAVNRGQPDFFIERLDLSGEEPAWTRAQLFEMAPMGSMQMLKEDAQMLMDDLWRCGLRPTEGAGSAGAMSATQKHLEDMRTLVFNPPSSR